MTYLDNGNVFVSSACGDSLIVSLAPAETKGDVKEDDTVSPSASSAPKNIHGKGKERAQEYFDAGAWTIFREAESEGEISVRERWMNIAPVKDFAVVEGEDGRVVRYYPINVLTAPVSLGRRVGLFQHQLVAYCTQRRRIRGRPQC